MSRYLQGTDVLGADASSSMMSMMPFGAAMSSAAANAAPKVDPGVKAAADADIKAAADAVVQDQQRAESFSRRTRTLAEDVAEKEAKKQKAVTAMRVVIASGLAGSLLGLIGGALLWKKHPVAGGVLGGLFVGPTVGYGVGLMIELPKAA